ncbi:MAG: beta-galactosidase [Bacteroidaceae bacterium]
MKMKRFGLLLTLAATLTYAQGLTEIRKVNGFDRLMVDGKPIVLLSGELHNSTSSTSASLDAAMCATKAMGLNSLIVSVAWEQIEPSEDTFDFSCVDNILAASEKYEMPAQGEFSVDSPPA